MKMLINEGYLYNNGAAIELAVNNGSDIRIQAVGTGSCKMIGKIKGSNDYKTLSLVKMSNFDIVNTIEDDEIYATDVTGCEFVTVSNVNGFTSIWANING